MAALMMTPTLTLRLVAFLRPSGMFSVGLVSGIVGGFAVLLFAA